MPKTKAPKPQPVPSPAAPAAPEPSAKPVPTITIRIAPDWTSKTPDECSYVLMMECNGERFQSIRLDRAEFIALKKYLAHKRGCGSVADAYLK